MKKDTVRSIRKEWSKDYTNRTLITAAISSVIGISFTIYNGFLGIHYSSMWNGTICAYYVFLTMIRGERVYELGLIPAITMATYTTYRITMSILHYFKAKKTHNIFVREVRTINLIDSMVAILTLQNTMILVNRGAITGDMKVLSIISSTIIWIIIVVLSGLSFVAVKRSGRDDGNPDYKKSNQAQK